MPLPCGGAQVLSGLSRGAHALAGAGFVGLDAEGAKFGGYFAPFEHDSMPKVQKPPQFRCDPSLSCPFGVDILAVLSQASKNWGKSNIQFWLVFFKRRAQHHVPLNCTFAESTPARKISLSCRTRVAPSLRHDQKGGGRTWDTGNPSNVFLLSSSKSLLVAKSLVAH